MGGDGVGAADGLALLVFAFAVATGAANSVAGADPGDGVGEGADTPAVAGELTAAGVSAVSVGRKNPWKLVLSLMTPRGCSFPSGPTSWPLPATRAVWSPNTAMSPGWRSAGSILRPGSAPSVGMATPVPA